MADRYLFVAALLWCTAPVAAQAPTPPGVAAFERAVALLGEDRREEARPHLVRAIEEADGAGSDELPTEAWLFRGALEREASDLPAAVASFQAGIARLECDAQPAPLCRALRLELAITFAFARRYEDAERTYAKVLADAPGDRDARLGLARVRFWRGDADGALATLGARLEQDAADVDALALRGDVLRAELRRREARRDYRAALAADPAHSGAREGLAAVDSIRRVRLTLGAGVARGADTLPRWRGALAVDLSPRVRLVGQYRQDLRRDASVSTSGEGWSTAPELAVATSVRASDRVTIDAGLQLRRGQDPAYRVRAALTLRAAEHWSVLLSTRPGYRPDTQRGAAFEHLGMAGLQRRFGAHFAMLQVFHYEGPGSRETAAALTGAFETTYVGVRATAALSGGPQLGGSAALGLTFHVTPAHDLRLGYELLSVGPTHALDVSWTGSF